jgi:hypothetical protein
MPADSTFGKISLILLPFGQTGSDLQTPETEVRPETAKTARISILLACFDWDIV